MNHATDACQNDHERQSKVKLAEFQERTRLHILAASVEFRILKAHLIEAVQGKFGYKQRREHRKHDTDCQRRRKALDGTGTSPEQNRCRNQGGYVSVDDRGKCLGETCLDRILDGCSQTDLLFDTGENDNVRIHRHTNRQDDTSHARKRQSHLKCN